MKLYVSFKVNFFNKVNMEKAIIIREYGNSKVLKLEDINVVRPNQDEIFIKHSAIGVHFHDCYVRSGLYKTLNLPGIPGLEAAGVIEEVGRGVSNFKTGDRIGYINSGYGAYSSHRVLDKRLAFKIPEFISDELIATNFSRSITVQMLIEEVTQLNPSDTILVTAATGGVGRLLCQWANALGACVIGTSSNEEKALIAKSYGCKYSLTYDQKDFNAQIRDITNGKGVEKVYDSVGLQTFQSSLESLAYCGHLINFGQSSGAVDPILMSTLSHKSLTISRPIIFHYIANEELYKKMTKAVFNAFKNKNINIPKAEGYSLKDASIAHDILESRRGGGSLFLKP